MINFINFKTTFFFNYKNKYKMKKLILLSLFTILAATAFPQSPRFLLAEFTYDSSNQKPLIFKRTLNIGSYDTIDFNLPFAYHFEIKGTTVEFSIYYDDVMWYFFRKGDKNYFDLEVNLYAKTTSGSSSGHGTSIPTTHGVGIIRIILMK